MNLQDISERDFLPQNMMFWASYKEDILLCLIDILAKQYLKIYNEKWK